ncbi:hypothetical protein [Denitromonas ohlonensis]|uniref:Uncharacterized protein n=2 Tax=Denitromonas TaxID=139331 RepID=A0A557SQ42_9RHOO|nr:hypothetical protein [Denitromonas ohlonensis]TVO65940.1 hypothetical protein FHP90_10740 [Denitromonas ohlonensis]TVO79533.1 hypothetical protein FHP89_01925 [Denitromonas ohlonensis]
MSVKNTAPVTSVAVGEIVDSIPPESTPAKRRVPPIKLHTLRDIKTELGKVYREARAGKLEPQDATRLAYLLRQIADLTVQTDLEDRITALEARTNE